MLYHIYDGNRYILLVGMVQSAIEENARIAQNQGEYQERYNGLVERYDTAKARYGDNSIELQQKHLASAGCRHFLPFRDFSEVMKSSEYFLPMKRQPSLSGSVPVAIACVKNIKSIWLIHKSIRKNLTYKTGGMFL